MLAPSCCCVPDLEGGILRFFSEKVNCSDDEITNIIWSEEILSDDHVVPFDDARNEKWPQTSFRNKEWSSGQSIPLEESVGKIACYGSKLENYSQFYHHDSIPSIPSIPSSELLLEPWDTLSDIAKTSETFTNSNSERVHSTTMETANDTLQSNLEQGSQTTFVDCGWMNTEDMLDLEEMLNDDAIFGYVNPGTADDLWPCPAVSHEQYTTLSPVDFSGSVLHSASSMSEILKDGKKTEKPEPLLQEYSYPMNYRVVENQLVHRSLQERVPPPSTGHLECPASIHYDDGCSSFMPLFSNTAKTQESQHVFPSKLNSFGKNLQTPMSHHRMTPQEKIEKLKRKQEKKAMLAIMKQKEQFNTRQPIKYAYIQQVEDSRLNVSENSGVFPCREQYPVADCHYSQEEATFLQLKNVLGGVHGRMQICLRDSLFRLAQSAIQRLPTSDSSSTSDPGVSIVENMTNSIDRTVAHLLFSHDSSISGNFPPSSSK